MWKFFIIQILNQKSLKFRRKRGETDGTGTDNSYKKLFEQRGLKSPFAINIYWFNQIRVNQSQAITSIIILRTATSYNCTDLLQKELRYFWCDDWN